MSVIRIIGIDPASVRMGYGVIDAEGEHLTYVECGVLEAPAKASRFERLGIMAAELETVLTELAAGELAFEEGFVQHLRGALTLGESRGVVIATACRFGVPVWGYPPSTVKKAVTGSGRAEKPQVAAMVTRLLGLRCEPQADAADALAVGITHARAR